MAKEGILSQVAAFEIAGLPVGAVAAGAVVGGAGDALAGTVSALAPQVPSWALKGGLAWAVIKYLPNMVGNQAAQLGGLFLAYDSVQELFNIRASVSNIVGGVTGKIVRRSPPRFLGAKGDGKEVAASAGFYNEALGGS